MIREQRLQRQIFKHLLEIQFHHVKDQRLQKVIFNHVQFQDKKRKLLIFVDIPQEYDQDQILLKLNKLISLFRRELSSCLTMYTVPSLLFVPDTLFKSAQRVEKILNDL